MVLCTGCQQVQFYHQAVSGHLAILAGRKSIPKLVEDPATPSDLRKKLTLVLELRRFAQTHLQLPADGHYLHYVDTGRSSVVWNVYAAPPLSVQAREWFYPFVGRLSYRGYFADADALKMARQLKSEGYDTYVGGVTAYSTLGWFRDPVLNTFIHDSDADLAELIFHELSHQKLFVRGDTDFNEAFATAVSEEGVRRWLNHENRSKELSTYQAACRRRDEFVGLVLRTRGRLEKAYSKYQDENQKPGHSLPAEAVHAKKEILGQLQEEYQQLRSTWGGNTEYDGWFNQPVNNAQLNTIDSYHRLVPAFRRMLDDSGGDLNRFFAEVRSLSKLTRAARLEKLNQFLGRGE